MTTSAAPPPLHHHQSTSTAVADGNSTTAVTTPWSSKTNWTVSRGSLDTAVTFESFDFPIDSESTAPKPRLLLVPPSSSGFEPCEIKINFTQKHEIRQVYVRSTARVYEIYYAPALQSENEYLCTVRCSAASVEDNLFPVTDVKEAVSVNLEGPNGILPKEKVAGETNIGTNEDDWVEVKLPAGRLDEGNNNSPNQSLKNIRHYQDYYEATAEINDSEPCMSLTLRLLSLQGKGCVYVDEVYVFADPIDSSDSENQTVNAESSTGSTLMTMLVPTLLGLTKSRTVQLHDQYSSKSVGKPERLETEPGPAPSTNPVNLANQQDEKLLTQSEAKAELRQFQVPAPAPAPALAPDKVCDSTTRNAFSYNQVENVLEQLVSRVSRIEDICLRFEENMLKPINSMEARLQRVEQQVELLTKNSQCAGSPSCPRFEPNPSSISNAGKNSQLCGESEPEKKGSGSNETHKPPEDVEVSTELPPGLVVTAPQSSCCDEKEDVNDVVESPKKEKQKKSVSIDDALAAALAGFSSFTAVLHQKDDDCVVPLESSGDESLKCNQAHIDTTLELNSSGEPSNFSESLKATAPEFTGEENDEAAKSGESLKVTAPGFTGEEIDSDDKVISPVYENGKTVATPKSSATGVLEHAGDSTTISPDGSTEILDDSFCSQGTSEVVDDEAVGPIASFSNPSVHENHTSKTDAQMLNFDKADILRHFPAHQSPNASDSTQVASNTNTRDRSESTVDFESPILEVKFASLESTSRKSPLEALLSYTGDDGVVITQETIMHAVEENPTTANNLLVELDGDHVEEGVQQDLAPIHQETFVSLI